MKRKLIASLLSLVIIGASMVSGYAYETSIPSYKNSIKANKETIRIISPKGNVIVQDQILISVKFREDVSVSLSVYKEESEDTLIFESEKVEQGKRLKFYNKQLKDLESGKYRMVFSVQDEDGKPKENVVKHFTVKNKKEEVEEAVNRGDTGVATLLNDILKD